MSHTFAIKIAPVTADPYRLERYIYIAIVAIGIGHAILFAPRALAVGQYVTGAGVAAGTVITAGSGSSWTVSGSPQTVGAEAGR